LRNWSLIRAFPALIVALGVAFAPAALAQGKSKRSGETRYDTPAQTTLLEKQVAALPAQRPGTTDIYAIGVAGWASQDVFLKEMTGALAVTAKALPITGTVRLINSNETRDAVPLATRKNFTAAVRAVARVMDKEEDVLLLFMTSHGQKSFFALELPRMLARLKPQEVAALLRKEGIKNRVVIVSACYSGIFVKPLANANSIVLTAADAKHTSFGCAPGREWTYFGDALFNHSLKPGTDFQHAYANARGLIAGWEKKDKLTPSNPQGHFGAALTRKLAPLFADKARS
jgi:hypothetical protein